MAKAILVRGDAMGREVTVVDARHHLPTDSTNNMIRCTHEAYLDTTDLKRKGRDFSRPSPTRDPKARR
jgi:hypothetical protein